MSEPYFADHDVTLHQGDALEVLDRLPSESVNCIVTSPPYFGLRDYGVDGQIGLEESPGAYVSALRDVFNEAKRVLRYDGVLWLNLGDSYYSGRGNPGPNAADEKQPARRGWTRALDRPGADWAKPKDLLGMPWRVAFALQDDGWTLRNAAIWHKPNAMPESVTDRLAARYENVFLFSASRRYEFDLDAIRAPHAESTIGAAARARIPYQAPGQKAQGKTRGMADGGANPGDVWSIPTNPFPGAHFATMPPELVRRCILAGCPTDGVVLDPFAGSGTTLMVARRLGRRSVGIELNPEYCAIAVDRIGQSVLDFSAAGGGHL